MQPPPAKTAEKAQNHSKEGPINATVGKSGFSPLLTNDPDSWYRSLRIKVSLWSREIPKVNIIIRERSERSLPRLLCKEKQTIFFKKQRIMRVKKLVKTIQIWQGYSTFSNSSNLLQILFCKSSISTYSVRKKDTFELCYNFPTLVLKVGFFSDHPIFKSALLHKYRNNDHRRHL